MRGDLLGIQVRKHELKVCRIFSEDLCQRGGGVKSDLINNFVEFRFYLIVFVNLAKV
jgi:hypothetical protein